jgi:hypothetical protein
VLTVAKAYTLIRSLKGSSASGMSVMTRMRISLVNSGSFFNQLNVHRMNKLLPYCYDDQLLSTALSYFWISPPDYSVLSKVWPAAILIPFCSGPVALHGHTGSSDHPSGGGLVQNFSEHHPVHRSV